MKRLFVFGLGVFVLSAFAAEPTVEIDPNTTIRGGADVRGSGAGAGTGVRSDNKMKTEPRIEERGEAARPDKDEPATDKPISERKPQEQEPGDAAKGENRQPR